jgi:ribonuclease Y
MPTSVAWYAAVGVALVAVFIIAFLLGILYRKRVSEREISSAEEEAKRIINESIKSAESKSARRFWRQRKKYTGTARITSGKLENAEQNSRNKNANSNKKKKTWTKNEALEKKNEQLSRKTAEVEALQEEIKLIKRSQLEMLEKISGYTVEEAKAYIISSLESEVTHEMAMKLKELEAQFKEEADARARELVATAIQRCAADHTAEITFPLCPCPTMR